MDPGTLLEGLDDAQRAAVTSPGRPLVILAPAGAGKTRVLTRRIAHRVASGDADPRRVLAITFTRKAAHELADRLRRLGLRSEPTTGTFHAVAWAQLRTRWARQRRPEPALVPHKTPLLAELAPPRPAGRDSDPRRAAGRLASEIEWAKARMVPPEGYAAAAAAAGRRPGIDLAAVAERYAGYERAKRARRLVDFEDLLVLAVQALEEDEGFAAAQRWLFRHLFVDELQDLNPLQFRLLEGWRGESDDVCAVGDPQQAIYGWNGADAGFILDIARWWPSAEVVELATSYRSTPQVLDAASAVLRGARQPARSVRSARTEGPPVRLAGQESDRAEAVAIARAARLAHAPGRPWSDQAVLVRTHAQIGLIAQAMAEAGIPHRIRGGAALLERPELRQALRALRGARAPLSGALADLEAAAEAELAEALEAGAGLDDPAVAERASQALEARGAIAVLVELGRDYLRADPAGQPAGFVAWLSAVAGREGLEDQRDALDIATFHAAKGLEWAVVHLAGVEDGFVPITHARTAAARAEEARLLYVAMTRAARELRVSWAERRSFGATALHRRRSPLLDPLLLDGPAPGAPLAVGAPAQPPGAGGSPWRDRISEQRALLARSRAPCDPAGAPGEPAVPAAALEALRAWRDRLARAARAEPSAVLADPTLERIAAAAPATAEELGAIRGVGPVLARRFAGEILPLLAHGGPPRG